MEASLGRPVRPAEIGCALSHRTAACWLARSPHAMALVLEDDIVPLGGDWQQAVAATASVLLRHALNDAAFICLLGARHDQADSALNRRVVSSERSPSAVTPAIFLHTDPGRALWRAHAYLISRAAAVRSCRDEPTIVTLADAWCERQRRGLIDEIFYTRPILIAQDEEQPSTIRPKDSADHLPRQATEAGTASRAGKVLRPWARVLRMPASARYRLKMATARIMSWLPYRVPASGHQDEAHLLPVNHNESHGLDHAPPPVAQTNDPS